MALETYVTPKWLPCHHLKLILESISQEQHADSQTNTNACMLSLMKICIMQHFWQGQDVIGSH